MKKLSTCFLTVFVVLSLVISQNKLHAAPYYEGKMITIIVGFGPGGGYDRLSRLIAKHLSKHIPGKPRIVIQNIVGAGSMVAANHLFNLTKPDGLTIGNFNRGLPFAQLLKAPGVNFDLRRFAWIGSANSESAVLALRADLPFKSLNDILKSKTPLHIASSGGPSDSATQFTLLLKEFVKIPTNLVNYDGSPEASLAIEQKEADGRSGTYAGLSSLLDRGVVRLWIRCRVPAPGIENLPVDEDLTTDKVGKTIMAMRSSADKLGRSYVATPGTPKAIMDILVDGFAKTLKDPAMVEDAKKNRIDLQFVPPEECLKVQNYILNQPEAIVKEAAKFIKF